MHFVLFLIWWMIAIFPTLVLLDATDKLSKFLKKRNIYHHWDIWHTFLLILTIVAILVYSST